MMCAGIPLALYRGSFPLSQHARGKSLGFKLLDSWQLKSGGSKLDRRTESCECYHLRVKLALYAG